MPLSLTGGATVVANNTFQARVALAFYFVAREVITENGTTTTDEIRLRFAYSVIRQDYDEFLKLAAVVVTDPTIVQALPAVSPDQASITDQMIVTAVQNVWSRLAGVGM